MIDLEDVTLLLTCPPWSPSWYSKKMFNEHLVTANGVAAGHHATCDHYDNKLDLDIILTRFDREYQVLT